VPNAIGDADHHPFNRWGTFLKASALLGEDAAATIERELEELPEASDVSVVLSRLP
jgi:hypothetical protein